jgi:PhnB protein
MMWKDRLEILEETIMATKKSTARKSTGKATKVKSSARGAKAAKPAKNARRKVAAIPKGYRTVTPYLVIKGAAEALAFYAKAFGAKQKAFMAMPDGSVMHAEIQIGDSMVMLAEENPGWGSKSPLTLGGNATHVMLYVKDCDAFFARAVAAGATVAQPLADQFWGDRYGKLADPFGHVWSIGTHIEDIPPKQMQKRADEAMKQMGPPSQ